MSQKSDILDYIHRNGSITSYEAYERLGITQLGARLKELQADGHEFATEWEENNGKRYKRYSLAGGQTSMFSDHETRISAAKREVEGI